MIDTYLKLRKIRKLKDLVRHHQRWAHQIEFARPIEKLVKIPKNRPHQAYEKIKEAIDKLLPSVKAYTIEAGIERICSCNITT